MFRLLLSLVILTLVIVYVISPFYKKIMKFFGKEKTRLLDSFDITSNKKEND